MKIRNKYKSWIASIVILLSVIHQSAFAQQDAMYTQYMFNMLPLNPAYAGSRDVISMTALYRNQWVNVPGAPKTATFSVDAPVAHEKVGLGLTVANDNIGVYNNFGATANFAYRIRLKKSTLAFGVSGGFSQFTANLTSVNTTTDVSNGADNSFSSNLNNFLPNVGAGIYYTSDKFYIGVSLPHLLNNPIRGTADNGMVTNALFRAEQFRHAFFMAGVVIKLSDDVKFKPSVLVKFVTNAPTQLDVNGNLWLYDKFGIGVSYRVMDAPSIILEWQMTDNWRIGLAYDWSYRIAAYTAGSAELMLRYELGYNKKRVITPRYF